MKLHKQQQQQQQQRQRQRQQQQTRQNSLTVFCISHRQLLVAGQFSVSPDSPL